MPTPTLSRGRTIRSRRRLGLVNALAAAALFACPASAQDGRTPESQKAKSNAERAAEIEASRFCGNVAPSVAEARIAWQTKRLGELDAQVKQRLADLEKAEMSMQEWVAKRDGRSAQRHGRSNGGGDPGQTQAQRRGGHSRRDGGGAGEQARILPLGRERRREKILMRLILPPMLLAIALSVSACWNSASEFMREPFFSPVGAGLAPEETAGIQSANALAAPQPPSTGPPPSLYSQPRIAHVGDIVRVIISINDKATLDNASGRSQTNKDGVVIDFGYNSGSASASSNQPSKALGDLSTQSSTQGQGNIDRSEQIQVSVAAIVTRVLANGNLVISGSQEVRVNYELRQLTVAGIVNPLDISLNNSVAYDRIAEARIAYGGRGRSNDFQQPPWGQQIYDTARPF
jgi:flagellar L-ring protein FlgH